MTWLRLYTRFMFAAALALLVYDVFIYAIDLGLIAHQAPVMNLGPSPSPCPAGTHIEGYVCWPDR